MLTGTGLHFDEAVASAADLNDVAGPFLTADVVDTDGELRAVVAVFDDADGQPDVLLAQVVQTAADQVDAGSQREAEPVLGAFELIERFASMPFSVAAFSDADQVRALYLVSEDRRGGAAMPASAPTQPAAVPLGAALAGGGSLDKLINVSLEVSVELGRTSVTLAEVMAYDVGSVVELDRAAGAPVDVRVNGTLLAQGEVVLIDDEYAVRITAVIDPKGPSA
jgi:flagellar motor switch protein FliN/FliY